MVAHLEALRGDPRYWAIWTGMWQPWQRVELVTALRLIDAPAQVINMLRTVLVKINRMMTVIAAKLFARRYEHIHIEARTAAYMLDPGGPPPPSPAAVVAGMVHDEYMSLTNLGRKGTVKKRRIASPSAPEEVAEAPGSLEAADEPLVGPQKRLFSKHEDILYE